MGILAELLGSKIDCVAGQPLRHAADGVWMTYPPA
jgi:hypothetical protein